MQTETQSAQGAQGQGHSPSGLAHSLDFWKGQYQQAGTKAQAQVAEARKRFGAEAVRGKITLRAWRAVDELHKTLTVWRSQLALHRHLLLKLGSLASEADLANYEQRMAQYVTIAAPFYADAQCPDGGRNCLGAAASSLPAGAVLSVGAIAFGPSAAAWALAYGADAAVATKAHEADLHEMGRKAHEADTRGWLRDVAKAAGAKVHQSPTANEGEPWGPVETGLAVLGGAAAVGTAGALLWRAMKGR